MRISSLALDTDDNEVALEWRDRLLDGDEDFTETAGFSKEQLSEKTPQANSVSPG